ncbi:hypothetical protein T12_13795 [Trichinella patagoniensis]|uniref:Uncharacterized protein n=2 Tax=Trichinella TaxID=6333 RepID=A0A0V1AAA3_9BILA|nr:hypothetical protein T05_1787 [Trichinella murrelli]KRY21572.1 hypothetical protein T12_13795 [Trichinella patagoniensis]
MLHKLSLCKTYSDKFGKMVKAKRAKKEFEKNLFAAGAGKLGLSVCQQAVTSKAE